MMKVGLSGDLHYVMIDSTVDSSQVCTTGNCQVFRNVIGTALSLSLPNLTTDTYHIEHLPEIIASNHRCLSNSELPQLNYHISTNDSSTMDFKVFSNDGHSNTAENYQSFSSNNHVSPSKLVGITSPVNQTNLGMSAVLENLPLVYIPQTKQLVVVKNLESGITQESPGMDIISGENTCPDLTIGKKDFTDNQINGAPEECMNLKNKSPTVKLESGNMTESSGNQEASLPGVESCDLECNDPPDFRHRHVSGQESEPGGNDLSQDSETSSAALSECTVVTHEKNPSPQVMFHKCDTAPSALDFDEISLDKLSVDRTDSPRDLFLNRNNTWGSRPEMTDASSYSSISSISTGTDFSVSAASYTEDYLELKGALLDTDDQGFMEINLHGARNSFERIVNQSPDSGIEDKNGAKSKRKGLTGFLTKSWFSKKAKEHEADSLQNEASAPGWKLFGRVPPKQVSQPKDPNQISQEYQSKINAEKFFPQKAKAADIEVASTTGLILEQRPMGLPSKSPEELEKHKQEYEAMLERAKRKELRAAKLRKKQIQAQLKQEEYLKTSLQCWNNEILPNWETTKTTKRARDLWWQGIPPSVRGRVWMLAIGNDLNITSELYEICLKRAKDRMKRLSENSKLPYQERDNDEGSEIASCKESSVDLIKLDVSRTFPQLCIFQKGGPYHELLQGLLGAYACYRPDVGYVQGMSFIAAVLLLNMEVDQAFICFANLLNQPCQIALFRLDETLMRCYFATYEEFLRECLPKLYVHFQKYNVTSDIYIIDWMFTLYAKALPLDIASRIWDVFCRDGEEFLFRTALGILKLYETNLLQLDFIHLAQFLTRIPDDISINKLFNCIENVNMSIEKLRFKDVLASYKDKIIHDKKLDT